jgi:predicted nuclease of predicted toxin-antitoxin system
VKFLVDNQLPAKLAKFMAARGHEADHVLDVGLDEASDTEIWKHAATNGQVLITKDEDFFLRACQPNARVQVVWLRLGNCRTSDLLAVWEKVLPGLITMLQSGQRIIEIR